MKLVCCLFTYFSLISPLWALKLISTSPVITETLFSLGLDNKLKGVSNFCEYPLEAKKYPKVGTSLSLNWEAIVKLEARTLLIQGDENSIVKKRAQTLGLKTLFYRFNTLQEIEGSIAQIGRDFNVHDKVIEEALKKIRQEKIKLKSLNGIKKKALLILNMTLEKGLVKNATIIGTTNHFHDIAALAGYENSSLEQGYQKWGREKMLKTKLGHVVIFNHQNFNLNSDPYFRDKKIINIRNKAVTSVGPRLFLVMKELYDKSTP